MILVWKMSQKWKKINVKSDKIFIGNGAIEIIQAIIHRFAKNKIVVNIPTFSSYYDYDMENAHYTILGQYFSMISGRKLTAVNKYIKNT